MLGSDFDFASAEYSDVWGCKEFFKFSGPDPPPHESLAYT